MSSSLESMNQQLKRVGRLPRRMQFGVLLFTVLLGWMSWIAGNPTLSIVGVAIGLVFFLLSLRVRAWATADTLVIRSYLRTYEVRFDEVEAFLDLPYAGLWNRGVGTDGWMNFGWRMLDIDYASGRSRDFPATMLSTKDCLRLAAALNSRLYENDSPASSTHPDSP